MDKTVSIITITQFSRNKCLNILKEHIKTQTYSNIIEWIIVEGSKTLEDSKNNGEYINTLIKNNDFKFPIVYIKPITIETKLGELRNLGNKTCKGDITVCMDDDDYYPNDRIQHAVEKLNSSDALIAGCSDILAYDYNFRKLFQFKGLGEKHSTNAAMAWKKEYLLTNSHDSTAATGEESSFTKKFTENMIQLDPFKTVIASSHSINSFNKKPLLIGCFTTNKTITVIDNPINKFINEDILKKYNEIFLSKNINNYDYVFFLGDNKQWNYESKIINNFTHTIIKMAEELAKKKFNVSIFANMNLKIVNKVEYNNWTMFPYEQNFKNIIVIGQDGLIGISPFNVSKNKSWLYITDDNILEYKKILNSHNFNYDKLMLMNNFDNQIKNIFTNITNNNLKNIPLIKEINFINKYNVVRNPYRFCYISTNIPNIEILVKVWTHIHTNNPLCELHLYGNFKFKTPLEKQLYQLAFNNLCIMNHCEPNFDVVSRELFYSTYIFTNLSDDEKLNTFNIYDSISIGCIPICNINDINKYNKFRVLHYDVNAKNISENIINSFNNEELINEIKTYNENIKYDFNNENIEDICKFFYN